MQKTINNLASAFIGESMARNRYYLYAKVAKEEGYVKVFEIFNLTADQEREHASWLFKLIKELQTKAKEAGKELKVAQASVPTVYQATAANLQAAIKGETYEYSEMYPNFAKVAKEEKLPKIAARLLAIAKAEEHHAQRYQKLLQEVENGTFFKKTKPIYWVCMECGYVHYGEEPPKECPSCGHDRGFYHKMCEDY